MNWTVSVDVGKDAAGNQLSAPMEVECLREFETDIDGVWFVFGLTKHVDGIACTEQRTGRRVGSIGALREFESLPAAERRAVHLISRAIQKLGAKAVREKIEATPSVKVLAQAEIQDLREDP